jgi:hypothetical protein
MRRIRHLLISTMAAALFGAAASPALAADNATVDASVSMAAPCLTVSTSQLDFGAQGFSPDGGSPSVAQQSLVYTSCSESYERVFAHGTSAAEAGGGSASWALSAASLDCPDYGVNKYGLGLHSTAFGFDRALTTVDQQLEIVGNGSAGSLDQATFRAPCIGSDGAGTTMEFQIVLTATF